MTEKLRKTIDDLPLIDQHAHPGLAGFFEDFSPEKRVITAIDCYRTPEESCSGFPYLREAHYEAYEKIYGFSRQAIDDPAQKSDLMREYDRQKNNLKYLIDKTMDVAGVETIIASSFLHHDLKNNKRIKFIPTVDPFIFPFDNTYLSVRNPLASSYLAALEQILNIIKVKNRYAANGFTDYLEFVNKMLEQYIENGAVGFKFLLSYIRTSRCENIPEMEGTLLFEKARKGEWAAYRRLQDLLIWHIMRKSVEYNMPVQWYCALTDTNIDYFDCLNLAGMINDPEVSKAKLVLLNGNYPSFDHAQLLAMAGGLMPNHVYIDISGRMMLASHPKISASILRKWLEKPILWDKILYGSDACYGERDIYVAAKVGRDTVYFALQGMMKDDIIDEATAITIAQKILRDNARKLYHL